MDSTDPTPVIATPTVQGSSPEMLAPPAPTYPDGAPIPADQVAAAAALPPAASIVEPAQPPSQPPAAPARAIVPTIGRVVLYSEMAKRNGGADQLVTRPALVVDVHSEFCITLQAFFAPWDNKAETDRGMRTSVLLDDTATHDRSWRWMPFQLGQAARPAITAEQLAAILGALEDLDERLAALEPPVATDDGPAPALVVGEEPTKTAPKPYRVH